MKRALKILLSLPFLVALGALAAYALGGFVAAPWWIKRELPQLLDKHLSATGSVGEVAINPFKLTLDVRDFKMTEAGGSTPALAFDRLFVDFEAGSLFRRAWTFADITLERPRLNLEADAKGELNLARLTPKNPPPKKEEPATGLPRMLLQNFVLKNGVVAFTDKAVSKPATAKLEPVAFELQDLSTLPDQRGEYTLAARLPAGGTLGWRGTITLAPIASAGHLELKALKLATLWQFLRDKLLIDEPGGSATLSVKYDARYADSKLAATARDMALRLDEISVRQRGAADTALTMGEVALSGGAFSLGERKVRFAELALGKITANTLIDADGKVNWAQLMASGKDAPAPADADPAAAQPAVGAPWQIGIDAITISDVRLSVLDQGFVKPLAIDIARTGVRAGIKASIGAETTATIDNIAVDVEDIRVAEAGSKDPLVSLASVALAGGAFDLAQKKFSVESIKLSKPVTAITRDASGAINLAEAFARKTAKPSEPSTLLTEIAALELVDGSVAFKDLGKETPLALDFQNIRVAAKSISSAATGNIPFEASLNIKQGGTLRAQGTAMPDKQSATVKLDARGIALMPLAAILEKTTTLRLASGAAYAAGQLDWNGQGKAAGIRYNGIAGLNDLRMAEGGTGAANADAAAQAKQAGTLKVQGLVTTNPQRASLKVEVRDIALAPLNPFIAKQTTLKLASGSAHATGQLDWNGQGKTPGVRYAGAAGIDALRLDHERDGERLVAWKALLAEGIQVDSAAKTARIEDVRLSGPAGKVAIAKDRSTNFSDIMRKPAPAAEPAAAQPAAEKGFAVNVERVHLSDGELDFSDQSLVLPYRALIQEFGGTITGVSTDPGTRTTLALEGRVDEFGQAKIGGTTDLAAPKSFTDIAVAFRNVAMSPLTPYSATFAGRRIASGKLSLDLQYKLNNSNLLGENKVVLEQFTLGERVQSPTAVNLPLDLAIALLTDSDGKIDLSVPVTGNVDKPEFAYGALIWQAIRTVITKIVTAPFRALASLFGGGAEKMDAIGFEAGRAQLAPPEREKLTRVAGVLKQRPQLRLSIEGRYDTTLDGAALRTAAARRDLAQRLGIKLASADDVPAVNFDNAKAQRAIEAMMEARAGEDGVGKFQAAREKSTGKPVNRVNAALALIGRGSNDRAFYEALFAQVIALQPLDKQALTSLATQRGAAIADYLKTSAGLDAARVGSKPAAEVKADKAAEITAALSLDATK